jgi:hypothetical protein
MTPKDKIEQTAKEYRHSKVRKRRIEENKFSSKDFKVGAEYVLNNPELQKEHITGFFDWYQKEGYKIDKDAMMGMPTDELFTLYLEHIQKQKQ